MTEERFVKDAQYKELRPANVYDVAANETWLEDMARQGYRLVGMTGWSGVFEKAVPFTCRYRMQPLSKKEKRPPEEMAEVYRELGWEYAGTIPETFHVWRCEDPDAPELDTDPVVQGMGYRYLRGKMRRDLILSALLLAALAGEYLLFSGLESTPLLDVIERFAPGQLTAGALAAILLVVLMTCQMRSMRRLLRFLDAGIPLERPRPYRHQKWLARTLAVALGITFILHFLGGFSTIDGGSLKEGWDAGDSYHNPGSSVVYVDLADLEGAERTESWRCRTKVQELCPRMYWTTQLSLGSAKEEIQPGNSYPVESSVETTYYRLLTAGLARQLAEELTQRRIASFGVDGHPALTAVETDDLDGLWWGEDRYYQFAVALLGRQVLLVEYEGQTDLRAAGDYLAGLLER